MFSKKVNGTYYVVEAAPVTKAKSVYVASAYMLENGKTPPGRKNHAEAASRLPDADAPWFTADTDSANDASAAEIVSRPTPSVNTESAEGGRNLSAAGIMPYRERTGAVERLYGGAKEQRPGGGGKYRDKYRSGTSHGGGAGHNQ